MSPELDRWKNEVSVLPADLAAFHRHFFVTCASVLLGDKEGELVVLRAGGGLSLRDKRAAAERLCRSWHLDFKMIWSGRTYLDLMVYRAARLDQTLRRVPLWVFDALGFVRPASGAEFLADIEQRWQAAGTIPHAIGLALGYPLKDVLGFTGLALLPCSGHCGWRIYGDPGRSIARKSSFVSARRRAVEFLV